MNLLDVPKAIIKAIIVDFLPKIILFCAVILSLLGLASILSKHVDPLVDKAILIYASPIQAVADTSATDETTTA